MNNQLLLSGIAAALVTALSQLLMFLLKRRPEIRALDRGSDAGLLTSATDLIAQHRADSASLREETTNLRTAYRELEAAMTRERDHFTQQLGLAHQENGRLAAEVARLRIDVDIANRQIDELRRRSGP